MVDALIIRFFADNPENIHTWYSLVDKKSLTRSGALLLEAIKEWSETHDKIWLSDVVASLMLKGITADQFAEVKSLAQTAMELDEEEHDWSELAEMLSARDTAFRIAEIADAVVAGRASLDDIYTMLEKHEQVTEDSRALHEAVLDCTPEQAFEDLYLSGGMQWSLDFLNRNIGPLQKGTFIIFGARPDTGKTTFLMDEASHFLKQGHRVVWFNNEERDRKVYFRLVQSTLGKTKQEIENDPKILDAFEQYKDNLFMVNIRKLKPQEVELLLDELQPDVVVFDQLYKMPGFNRKDNDVQRIHSLFIWARELAANKDCAVITAHLADAEAAGKEFPEMHMLYMGKTGPQSEADFIVMMGRSFEESNGFVRGLNIVKLKETMPGCDPVMRTYIEIDPYRVEVRELENE